MMKQKKDKYWINDVVQEIPVQGLFNLKNVVVTVLKRNYPQENIDGIWGVEAYVRAETLLISLRLVERDSGPGELTHRLTERGQLAKELGGYTQYEEYRNRELNLTNNQRQINRWLIAATILSAISYPITELTEYLIRNSDNRKHIQKNEKTVEKRIEGKKSIKDSLTKTNVNFKDSASLKSKLRNP